jgi:Phosphotransferase enzyme family
VTGPAGPEDEPPALAPWGGDAAVLERLGGGYRNRVWAVRVGGRRAVARDSGAARSGPALDWELELLGDLAAAGFRVPEPVPTTNGRPRVGGLVVTTWLDGDPPAGEGDWRLVADELARLHRVTAGRAQRPGFASTRDLLVGERGGDVDLGRMPAEVVALCRAAWSALACTPGSVVHGDPGPQNLRLLRGRVGLLDWDESGSTAPSSTWPGCRWTGSAPGASRPGPPPRPGRSPTAGPSSPPTPTAAWPSSAAALERPRHPDLPRCVPPRACGQPRTPSRPVGLPSRTGGPTTGGSGLRVR